MNGKSALWVVGTAVALFGGTAAADVVKLRNGDLLEGKATDLGESVRVTSPTGTVELPWSKVDLIDREGSAAAVLGDRLAAVEEGDARGLYAVALWAGRQGLVEEAREICGRVVALDPDHAAARAALGEERTPEGWKRGADLLRAKGLVLRDGKWILKAEAEALERRAALERRVTEEEERAARLLESLGDRNPSVRSFASEALASVDPALKRRLFLVGVRHRNPLVRAAAADGLGVEGDEGVVRSLLHAAVMDHVPEVRAAAAASLKEVALPEIVHPLMRALHSSTPQVRVHAAEALGTFGSRTSVETLIKRVHWVAGPSNRANIQVLNQVSYIRDFDVEIAQLAQIGDPIIGILQEGVVLDVKVFGAEGWDTVVERRAYTRALSRITGRDFGDDAGAWAKWWIDEGKAETAALETSAQNASVATPR